MTQAKQTHNKKLITKLIGVVAGMFLFAFALVPLYDVFCQITGINGKTRGQALYKKVAIDQERLVTIEFLTNVNRGMPWQFESKVRSIKVHPGELNEVIFYAKNSANKTLVGQTVPSVSPGEGSLYLNKTECFCFEKQVLTAGEEVEMPMKFYIDRAIPQDITHLTLSYQLFNVTEAAQAELVATK